MAAHKPLHHRNPKPTRQQKAKHGGGASGIGARAGSLVGGAIGGAEVGAAAGAIVGAAIGASRAGGVVAPSGAGTVVLQGAHTGHWCELWADGLATPTPSGYGGWTVVPREGQMGVVDYTGVEPRRFTLPILVDGWSEHFDCQPAWDVMYELAHQQGDDPPEEVYVRGLVPRALSTGSWLIESIVSGTQPLRDKHDRLLRHTAVLTMLDPVTAAATTSPVKQAQKDAAKHKQKAKRTIRARKGDTLVLIAGRELHDPGKWHDIANLNKVNGRPLQPDNVKPHQLIKLP